MSESWQWAQDRINELETSLTKYILLKNNLEEENKRLREALEEALEKTNENES